jgi:uncharacterized protein (DUF1501 family)
MNQSSRRSLLKAAGAGIASLAFPFPAGFYRGAFAGETRKPTLVVIYLRGGMDALNVVIPYKDKRYYDLRPTLAIPQDQVIKLDGKFGLHPALKALKPFYDQKRLAPFVNVGSPHPTRSHFDAQDFMEYAAPGVRTLREGWLNRYLARSTGESDGDRTRTLRALAMQGLLPRSLRGSYPVVAIPDRKVLKDKQVLDMFGKLYGDEGSTGARRGVLKTGRETSEALKRFEKILSDAETKATKTYPATPLGTKLRAIAQVIRSGEGLEVAALDIAGWDTHANQGAADGSMPALLRGLGDGLAAFMADLGPLLDSTVIVTMTEFGRTCKENGNFGTDHGHGGAMLVMGGGIQGGEVHGKWAGIDERSMYQGRDLKVTTDFRSVFGEILTKHFRFKPPRGFFPDYRDEPVRGLFA